MDFRPRDGVLQGNQSAVHRASQAACLPQDVRTVLSCFVLICSLIRADGTPTVGPDWQELREQRQPQSSDGLGRWVAWCRWAREPVSVQEPSA